MEIICYACGKEEMPENTIEAIWHCQEVNPDWRIEMDIQMTKDGELVLFHDNNLKRIAGIDLPISQLTVDQLQLQNAGYNFIIKDNYPYGEKRLQVPSLREVFIAFPDTKMLMDIHCSDTSIVKKLIGLIDSFGSSQNLVLVSKHHHIVKALRKIKTQWIYGPSIKEAKKLILLNMLRINLISRIKAHIVMLPIYYNGMKLMTDSLSKTIKRAWKKLWLWLEEGDRVSLIDSENALTSSLELQPEGVFTATLRKFANFYSPNSLK